MRYFLNGKSVFSNSVICSKGVHIPAGSARIFLRRCFHGRLIGFLRRRFHGSFSGFSIGFLFHAVSRSDLGGGRLLGLFILTDEVRSSAADTIRYFREQGVTVMHLRIAVSEEDSAAAIYDRTRAAVRSYLTLYPDVGLILDLRRSAELTEEGGILRTAGKLNGETCAQLRISISAHRPEAEVKRDLSVALALREVLWQTSPTVSRPVWIKSGSGIAGDEKGVSALTLELGSAGNSFGEAAALIPLLAESIAHLVSANPTA
jgi:stage II sporulation protein P